MQKLPFLPQQWPRLALSPVRTEHCSFSALTLLVGSFDPEKPVTDMTYNVFAGTLSLTQSIMPRLG